MKTSMESRYYEKVGHVMEPKLFPSQTQHFHPQQQQQLAFPHQQFQQQQQFPTNRSSFPDRPSGQPFSSGNQPEPALNYPSKYIQQNPKTYPHQQQHQQYGGNRNAMAPSAMPAPHMMQGGGNGGGDGSFGGGFQLKQNNGYYYNTGHPMGTLSNPLMNLPEGFKPNFGLSRDEMKDKLAESLASDTHISCLPGFKPRNDTRLSCAGQFPYALENPNPVVTNQRKMFGQERPSSPIRRSQAVMGNVGKSDFGEGKFQGMERMSSIPNLHPVLHPSLQNPTGISSLTNQMSQFQSNFRRGTMGTWASLGTPGPNSTSVQEAKAIKAGYRQELEKQIEQAKLRKQEEERREKDINDHPLGASYAQPKQYIPPKFLAPTLTSMEIAQRMIRSEPRDTSEVNKNNSCCSEPPRSSVSPANKSNLSRDSNFMQRQSQPQPGESTGRASNCVGTTGSNVNYSNNEIAWPPKTLASSNAVPQSSPAQMQPQPWPIYPAPPMIPFPSPYPPQYFHQPQHAYPPPPPPPMIYNLPPYPQALSSSPAQPCSWQGSSSNLHGWAEGKNQNAPKTDNNSQGLKTNSATSQNSPAEESYLETELENFDQLMEGMPLKQFTWQTSDQLPDPALKTAIYKEELRRQIIQKKKDEEEKAQRERDEEEKLERKIQEYDERMKREVKQEQNRSYVKTNMQTSQHREQVRMNAEQFGGVSERERLEAQIQEKNKLSQKQQQGSREKHSNKSFEHQVEGAGDANEIPDRSPRTASPPVPSFKKRLETQSESSLHNLERKSGRNMHALSDILNSLGLEKQRMERVIKRKLNLH